MPSISRRGLIGKAALFGGTILLASSDEALAATVAVPAALGEKSGKDYLPTFSYEPKPLPFAPKKLSGFEAARIEECHEMHYVQAVKRLNGLHAAIAKMPPHTPPYLMGSLKREELNAYNNVVLHEHFFAGLGGDGQLSKTTKALLERSFGSLDAWRSNLKLVARSLNTAGGCAAVMYSPLDERAHNVCLAADGTSMLGATPLLVIDLCPSLSSQFGDVSSYIDAFLANANWAQVAPA